MVGKDRRAEGGAHARHLRQILDGHRQAGEQAVAGDGIGALPRAVETGGRNGVDRAVDLTVAQLGGVDHLGRRYLAGAQLRHRPRCGQAAELRAGFGNPRHPVYQGCIGPL